MKPLYDINDPFDLSLMQLRYDAMSEREWQAYIDFTQQPDYKHAFSYNDIACLIRMAKKAGKRNRPADKDMLWGLGIAHKIENLLEQQNASEDANTALQNEKLLRARHVTLRVAWHDNMWDGSICRDPLRNRYCSGFHSLLSDRLRKRKENNLTKEIAFKGQPITEEYVPPCFWSVNLFGKQNMTIEHDNPAEPKLKVIQEELPAYSMFSWPFAVSFTRTSDQKDMDGAYPRNLDSVRIPKFHNGVMEGRSIAFMYANFSNPLTEEDQKYVVIGCGLVTVG